jgi:hypothetical protein
VKRRRKKLRTHNLDVSSVKSVDHLNDTQPGAEEVGSGAASRRSRVNAFSVDMSSCVHASEGGSSDRSASLQFKRKLEATGTFKRTFRVYEMLLFAVCAICCFLRLVSDKRISTSLIKTVDLQTRIFNMYFLVRSTATVYKETTKNHIVHSAVQSPSDEYYIRLRIFQLFITKTYYSGLYEKSLEIWTAFNNKIPVKLWAVDENGFRESKMHDIAISTAITTCLLINRQLMESSPVSKNTTIDDASNSQHEEFSEELNRDVAFEVFKLTKDALASSEEITGILASSLYTSIGVNIGLSISLGSSIFMQLSYYL